LSGDLLYRKRWVMALDVLHHHYSSRASPPGDSS
jgi:hypothetical protein